MRDEHRLTYSFPPSHLGIIQALLDSALDLASVATTAGFSVQRSVACNPYENSGSATGNSSVVTKMALQ